MLQVSFTVDVFSLDVAQVCLVRSQNDQISSELLIVKYLQHVANLDIPPWDLLPPA